MLCDWTSPRGILQIYWVFFSPQIKAQLDGTIKSMSEDVFALKPGDKYLRALPSKGLSEEEVLKTIDKKYKDLGKD